MSWISPLSAVVVIGSHMDETKTRLTPDRNSAFYEGETSKKWDVGSNASTQKVRENAVRELLLCR